MKFIRLVYGRNPSTSAGQYINLGDYFQTFALDHIYEQLDIPREDIITVDRSYLNDYKGVDAILTMQGYFSYMKGIEIFPLPKTIHPVFIGYHCLTNKYYKKAALDTYKNCEPVGCRDEGTYRKMKKSGIDAYLSGCLTITLPQRSCAPKDGKVFLVDAPRGIEEYIPQQFKGNTVTITQELKWNDNVSYNDELKRMEEAARALLERYAKEATLVVTSRLHCAGPCLAMGIPVILAREYFDDRYGWIEKYTTLYTPKQFSQIDWNVQAVDMTEAKKEMLEFMRCVYLDRTGLPKASKKIHEYYMRRKRGPIHTPFKTKAYHKVQEINPGLADFLRERLLKQFSVATARNDSEVK